MCNYDEWEAYLGKTTGDPALIEAFRNAGFDGPPAVPENRFETKTELGRLTLTIRSPQRYGKGTLRAEGVGVLGGIAIHVRTDAAECTEKLPYGFTIDETRVAATDRMGAPDETDFDECWIHGS